jgi:hypothetical protein
MRLPGAPIPGIIKRPQTAYFAERGHFGKAWMPRLKLNVAAWHPMNQERVLSTI